MIDLSELLIPKPSWLPLAAKALLVVALFGGGAVTGGQWVARGKNAEISQLRERYASTEAAAAKDARSRLEAAQERGDVLQTRLFAAESTRQTQLQETRLEIQRLTTGRPCLAGAAVRLLNREAAGLRLGALPTPASGTAATDGAAATDSDLGLWMATSISQYGQCRERLQALIDWHEVSPNGDASAAMKTPRETKE